MTISNNQNASIPGGDATFGFKMHLTWDQPIPCVIDHPKVIGCVASKVSASDVYDLRWNLKIFFGQVNSIFEVDQLADEIKNNGVFDRLAFALDTLVKDIRRIGHSLAPRAQDSDGNHMTAHLMLPMPAINAVARSGCAPMTIDQVHAVEHAMSSAASDAKARYMELFHLALGSSGDHDPLVQFLLLYLILDLIKGGSQKGIDRLILHLEPNTPIGPSPRYPNGNVNETIYMRLRNDFVHARVKRPGIVRDEILQNLHAFRSIVRKAIQGVA